MYEYIRLTERPLLSGAAVPLIATPTNDQKGVHIDAYLTTVFSLLKIREINTRDLYTFVR